VEFARSFALQYLAYAQTTLTICALFVAIELLLPRGEVRLDVRGRLKTVGFWLVYIVAVMVTTQLFAVVWGPLWGPLGVKPLLADLTPRGLPGPVAAVIGALAAAYVGDFVYYWCHRAQHAVPWLWRFHAVHHSVREMSGATAYHHVSESLVKLTLYTAPLAFLTQDPFALPVMGWMVSIQGYYVHSPTRLTFGPLGRLFVDNRFHRIHHSIEPRHFDKNFGVFTTLWDSLFGTAHFPAAGEWPDTGVPDFPEPAGVRAFLFASFSYRPVAKIEEAPAGSVASEI
jgi:sterol desaturase/sphingolipid hydroxylase (fatty acid hydroxylase superfamily)